MTYSHNKDNKEPKRCCVCGVYLTIENKCPMCNDTQKCCPTCCAEAAFECQVGQDNLEYIIDKKE